MTYVPSRKLDQQPEREQYYLRLHEIAMLDCELRSGHSSEL